MSIKFLNITESDFIKDYESMYRFIPVNRFLDLFKKEKLTFLYPGLWNDPFEKLFLEAEYSIDGTPFDLPIKDRLYSLCWTKTKESEAYWKTYMPLENGIRIKSSAHRILEELKNFDLHSSYKIYIGKVKYENFDKIMACKSDSALMDKVSSRTICDEHIQLMLMKRKAFIYEDEIRILLYPDYKKESKTHDIKLKPKSVFDDFLLDPRMEEPISDMIKEYCLSNYGVKIKKSRLYEKKKLKIQL